MEPIPTPELKAARGTERNRQRRVVVAEDEQRLRRLYEMALESDDLSICSFADGRSALDEITHAPCDLMILDLRMPGLDGIGLLEAMHERRLNVPVVISTADLDVDSFLVALRHGVVIFLRKPFSIDRLRSAVWCRLNNFADTRYADPFSELSEGDLGRAADLFRKDGEPSVAREHWLNLIECLNADFGSQRLKQVARRVVHHALELPLERVAS